MKKLAIFILFLSLTLILTTYPCFCYAASYEMEPNDEMAYATSITLNQEIQGNLWSLIEYDWFSFSVSNAGTVNISFRYKSDGCEEEIEDSLLVEIRDSSNNMLSKNYINFCSTNQPYKWRTSLSSPGTYYVVIHSPDSSKYTEESYNFTVSVVTSQISIATENDTVLLDNAITPDTDESTSSILVVSAVDGDGNSMEGVSVSLSVNPTDGLSLSAFTGETDESGELNITVQGLKEGSYIVTAEGLQSSVSQVYNVVPYQPLFGITDPEFTGTAIKLRTGNDYYKTITVLAPEPITSVAFVTSVGTWNDTNESIIIEDVEDLVTRQVSANIKSDLGGFANVQIYGFTKDEWGDTQFDASYFDSLIIQFIRPSKDAVLIILKSDISTVSPSTDTEKNIVNIIAEVRTNSETGSQVVSDFPVSFSMEKLTGSGETLDPVLAFTDEAGIAKTTFTSGELSSDADGIIIKAQAAENDTIDPAYISIVVGDTPGSVFIGRGTTLGSDDTTYYLPMSVLVADSNGNAISEAQVSLNLWPVRYYTGFWIGASLLYTGIFGNEDINQNLILDTGEDKDLNYMLTPHNSDAGSIPQIVTTDSNGVATFDLVYLKQSALWLVDTITASTLVLGTEVNSSLTFLLPALSTEVESGDLPAAIPESSYELVISGSPGDIVAHSLPNNSSIDYFNEDYAFETLYDNSIVDIEKRQYLFQIPDPSSVDEYIDRIKIYTRNNDSLCSIMVEDDDSGTLFYVGKTFKIDKEDITITKIGAINAIKLPDDRILSLQSEPEGEDDEIIDLQINNNNFIYNEYDGDTYSYNNVNKEIIITYDGTVYEKETSVFSFNIVIRVTERKYDLELAGIAGDTVKHSIDDFNENDLYETSYANSDVDRETGEYVFKIPFDPTEDQYIDEIKIYERLCSITLQYDDDGIALGTISYADSLFEINGRYITVDQGIIQLTDQLLFLSSNSGDKTLQINNEQFRYEDEGNDSYNYDGNIVITYDGVIYKKEPNLLDVLITVKE